MCGIFGLLLNRSLTEADVALGRSGVAALSHRGPDGSGEFIDRAGGVYLGHRRLKIVDLSEASAQPMRSGAHVLTYNGEIYNFRAVRQTLEQGGVQFRSTGDTEVLLAAWQRWGAAALDRLDGMFAFVLWDGVQASLAVDPFGEKHLYLAETTDGLYFASELAVLVRLLRLEPDLAGDALLAFLALGFVPAPETAYRGVRHLAPATALRGAGGRVREERRYWTCPEGTPGRGAPAPLPDSALERLHRVLAGSLSDRMIADVPLCVFASNGVDSTLVAAVAARDLGADVECLTVKFAGDSVDESIGAALVARRLGLRHRVAVERHDPAATHLDHMLDMFGQPNDNASVMATYRLACTARDAGYVAGLTGTGGDEAFFGYLKQQMFWRRRRLYSVPAALRRGLGSVLAPLASASGSARRFRDLFGVPDGERYLAVKNQPAFSALRRVPGLPAWAARVFGGSPRPIELQVPALERDVILPGSQLTSVDVGAMRAGVELRTPFLSRALFEVIAEYDPRAFLAFGQKSVARRLLGRYIPVDQVLPAKQGLMVPVGRVLAGRAKPVRQAVPAAVADEIWAKRAENSGWDRLAVRLALFDALAAWAAKSSKDAGAGKLAAAGR